MTQPHPPVVPPPPGSRRRVLETSWAIGVVAFVVVRFALAYSALAEYDRLTVIIFGILDLGTAVPYAIGTARLVGCLVDRRPQDAARWGVLASVCFLAPYLWIAWAGRDGQFPAIVYVVVALLVVCLGANAIYGVRRRVRVERAESRQVAADLVAGGRAQGRGEDDRPTSST